MKCLWCPRCSVPPSNTHSTNQLLCELGFSLLCHTNSLSHHSRLWRNENAPCAGWCLHWGKLICQRATLALHQQWFYSTLEWTPKENSSMLDFQQQGHWDLATSSSLPPVLCWLCLSSFVSDLFGCSTGKGRMSLSFCHNDSSFFSASLSYFKIISPSLPILPFHKHCFSSFTFCIQYLSFSLPSLLFLLEFLHLFFPSSLFEIPFSLHFFFILLLNPLCLLPPLPHHWPAAPATALLSAVKHTTINKLINKQINK